MTLVDPTGRPLTRRAFMRITALGGAGLFVPATLISCGRTKEKGVLQGGPQPVAQPTPPRKVCLPTEDNIEGPFYRRKAPFRTRLATPGTPGTPLHVSGGVFDTDCRPIPGTVVDIWHAGSKGQYDNSSHKFQYRGRIRTDKQGRYSYTTVFPGRYAVGPSGYGGGDAVFRPAHVHYKISGSGFRSLITQHYFEGDEWNERDRWLKRSLVTPVINDPTERAGIVRCTFDIVLARA